MANTTLVTTGLFPVCVGSVETFCLSATLNLLPWNLVGATVSLVVADPSGGQTTYVATYGVPPGAPVGFGSCWYVAYAVTAPAGDWRRSWQIVDVLGIRQVGQPIPFTVVTSP